MSEGRGHETRFHLFDFVPAGVLVVDEHGLILYANARVGTLLGLPTRELKGRPFEPLLGRQAHHGDVEFRALDEPGLRAVFVRDTAGQHLLEERRARAADRAARLYSLSAALSAAVDLETVAAVILSTGLDAVRTDSSLLMRVIEGGRELEVLGEVGGGPGFVSQGAHLVRASGMSARVIDGRQRCGVDVRFPHGDVVRERSPLWLCDPSEIEARFPALGPTYAREKCRALACLPLSSRGEVIGALRLAFTQPRAFDAEDRVFLMSLAQQCALALDRAQLYEQALAARDQAERAAVQRDEVLSIVAHDLGNPMSVISLWAQLILEEATGETARVGAAKIKDGIGKMSRLLQDLGDISALDGGHLAIRKEERCIETIVQETVELLAPLCLEKELTLRATATPLGLWCDPGRVQQVLGNLVANAIKFTPEGGRITIEALASERDVRFSVADTGPGIDEAARTHVFDRYWRAKMPEAPEGTGLGLFISKGIVEAHGGRIWVESPAAGGSLFCFTIPRARG